MTVQQNKNNMIVQQNKNSMTVQQNKNNIIVQQNKNKNNIIKLPLVGKLKFFEFN